MKKLKEKLKRFILGFHAFITSQWFIVGFGFVKFMHHLIEIHALSQAHRIAICIMHFHY